MSSSLPIWKLPTNVLQAIFKDSPNALLDVGHVEFLNVRYDIPIDPLKQRTLKHLMAKLNMKPNMKTKSKKAVP